MMSLDKFNVDSNSHMKNYAGEMVETVLNFIIPIILVVLSIAILLFYIVPTYKSLSGLDEQISAETQEVFVLQAKVDQLKSLQDNKDLVVSDLLKMSWALEERDKVPELSEQVRLMARDTDVVFKSLGYIGADKGSGSVVSNPAPDASATGVIPDPELYREEKVNVSVNSANLSQLIKFLKMSESSIRLFRVESLRISGKESGKEAALVMLSPYLNPSFSNYTQSVAPIDLNNGIYRGFMNDLDAFSNYAEKIDATLPKI